MASKRDQIKLTPRETGDYIRAAKIVIVGTNGPRGLPHMVPMWFVVRQGAGDEPEIWGWTFAKSQKTVNLQRDPRATLLFEDGVLYHELRAVMIEGEIELQHDQSVIRQIGVDLFTKYGDGNPPAAPVLEMIDAQTPKRIGLRFIPKRFVSWDHRKLGGAY